MKPTFSLPVMSYQGNGILMATLLVLSLVVAACSDSNESIPQTVDDPVIVADIPVPTEGATIEKEDIAVTFPANTFTADTKVALEKVAKGKMLGEDEVSDFYKLIVPADVRQPFTVKIKCDKQADDINVVAHMPAMRLSEGEPTYSDILLDATYKDGEYTVTIPAAHNDGEEGNVEFNLGLARMEYLSGDNAMKGEKAPSRAILYEEKFTEGNVSWHFTWSYYQKVRLSYQLSQHWEDINNMIREAIKKLHGLGLEVTTRDVGFSFASNLKDAYGAFCQSSFDDTWSTIELNETRFNNEYSDEAFRRTCIHELMHMFQSDYDPRMPPRKLFDAGIGDLNYLMMYESVAVWAEQLMVGSFSHDFTSKYEKWFIRGMLNPDDMYTGPFDTEKTSRKRYESHGYGMSVLIQYITHNMKEYNLGDSSIVELYKIWNRTNKYPKDCIEELTKTHGRNLIQNYDDFIKAYLMGDVIDQSEVNQIDPESGGKLTPSKPVLKTEGTCYVLGCRPERFSFEIPERTFNLDTMEVVIEQEQSLMHSHVIFFKDLHYDYKDYAIKGSPVVISGKELKKNYYVDGVVKGTFFVASTTSSVSSSETSKLKVSLRGVEKTDIKIKELSYLVFDAGTGMELNYKDYWGETGTAPDRYYDFYFPYHDDVAITQNGTTLHVVSLHNDDVTNDWGEKLNLEYELSFDIEGFDGKFDNCVLKNVKMKYHGEKVWNSSDDERTKTIEDEECDFSNIKLESHTLYSSVKFCSLIFEAAKADGMIVNKAWTKSVNYYKDGKTTFWENKYAGSDEDNVRLSIQFYYE